MKETKYEHSRGDENIIEGKCHGLGEKGSGGTDCPRVEEGGHADDDPLEQQQVHHGQFVAQRARALLEQKWRQMAKVFDL